MKTLKIVGKYLDQPLMVAKFSKAVPGLLFLTGGAYAADHIHKSPKGNRRKESIKTISVLSATILSALAAPKITSRILKQTESAASKSLSELKSYQSKLVDEFLASKNSGESFKPILNKAKGGILSFLEMKKICTSLSKDDAGKAFLEKLVPNPENIDSKHIFREIKRLSILGVIPVLGGILGGIAGDVLTEKKWKEKIPDKIKEGSYQYLANIFLCNVGAGAALYALEKAKITSKAARAFSMIGGIALTGIVGGSAIANFIGRKCIDPIFGKTQSEQGNLYSQRKPEALDVGLHLDDVATVAVLSGLKWIEPALPALYSISGYRAGIGYRNGYK